MAYQSFGEDKGDSDSFGKLKAIKLPDLAGKSFLDVGCNAGFFCGAALESGAARVVGVDQSEPVIEAAQQRYPQASFHATGWNVLPEGVFDVVILLSALHYAEDQAALVERLMQKVAKEGLLVLEVGIAPGTEDVWVETKRAIDTRLFPTLSKMHRLLERYTYRLIGPSVQQAGDPNPRFVFHVWHRRPVVLACLGDSGVGKSDLARLMAGRSGGGIRIFHIDDYLIDFGVKNGLVAGGNLPDLDGTVQLVDLSELYLRICQRGMVDELADYVAMLIRGAPLSLIEGGLPYGYRTHFLNRLGQLLEADIWSLAPSRVRSIETPDAAAANSADWVMPRRQMSENDQIVGHVDELRLTASGIVVVGWGYDCGNHEPIEGVRIVRDDFTLDLMQINRRRRPDVSRQLQSDLDMLGFVVEVPLETSVLDRLRMNADSQPLMISLWASGMLSPRMRPPLLGLAV